jgi:TIR domain
MDMAGESDGGIKVFFSYSHKDKELRDALDEHLGALKREGIIDVWWDGQIEPGVDWPTEIAQKLETADLILLLVSSAFLNSTFCYDKEMRRAVERHEAGTARVVPIALRQCYWGPAPFAKLQGLPNGMNPITSWPKSRRDAVLAEVAKGIHEAATTCVARKASETSPEESTDSGVPLFHVPFSRNRFFTGRDELLAMLYEALEGQKAAVVALTGLGG